MGNQLVTFDSRSVGNNVLNPLFPTVIITSDTPHQGITGSDTVSYTATFNRAVTGFDISDITVSGTASGNLPMPSRFAGTGGDVYTFDVETTSDGTITVSIPENAAMDAANNGNAASATYTVTVNSTAPIVILDANINDGGITNSDTVSYTATFSEIVDGFDISDITVSGTASGNLPVPSNFAGTGDMYTFDVETTSDGTILVSIPENAATDAADNGNAASATYTVTVDTTPPIIESVGTSGDTRSIEIMASEPLMGTLGTDQFTVAPSNPVVRASLASSSIMLGVLAPISDDSHTVSYSGYNITDVAGNRLAVFRDVSITPIIPDTVEPDADLNIVGGIGTGTPNTFATNSNPVSYTVTFTEVVTGFTASDISISGTASGGSLAISNFAGDQRDYSFDVETASDGTVVVRIPENTAIDAANNGNMASSTITVTVDTAPPTVKSIKTTSATTIAITAFDPLGGFARATDFTVSGNNVSDAAITGSIITLTVETAIASTDAPTVSYRGSSIHDGINNALGTFDDMPVTNTLSEIPLTVTITATGTPDGGTHDTDTISYVVTFNKVVTDFAASDIDISGTAAGGSPTISNFAGSGIRYTFDVTTIFDGTVMVSISEDAATDMAGNGNAASGVYTVTLDILVPIGISVNFIDRPSGDDFSTFDTYRGIVINSTNILVVDAVTSSVHVFDTDGNFVRKFFQPAASLITRYDSIAIASASILVTDPTRDRVDTFETSGTYRRTIGGPGNGQLDTPRGITTTPTHILVADSLNNRIEVFDLNIPHAHVRNIGTGITASSADGQFKVPTGITANSTHILVADTGNHRIQVFDLDGNYVSQFGSLGSGDGQFINPRGITTTPTHILVTDTSNHRIQVFDLDGNYVSKFGSSGSGYGQFRFPLGITTNSTHILVTEPGNARIQILDHAPTVAITSSTPDGSTQDTDTLSYTVTFSEAVTGFDAVSDISLSGTATATVLAPTGSDAATYTFDVDVKSKGTVVVSIPKLVATDTAGNRNLASDVYAVTVDTDDVVVAVSDSPVISDAASLKFIITHTDTPAISDVITGMGSIAASDSPTISDTASLELHITHTDTPAISDESDMQTMGALTPSDSPTISDTASLELHITHTDTPAISDESDMQTMGALTPSDSPTISDAASLELHIIHTDTPAISDVITGMGSIETSDSPTISDTASLNIVITHTDTPAISDESDMQTMGALTPSDSPVISDTASLELHITHTDTPAISDESDMQTMGALTPSDSPVISDTASLKFFITHTDTPAISDESDMQTMGALTQSDSPVISDTASLKFFIIHTDTPAISDESDMQTMGALTQSDSPTISDTASLELHITHTDTPAISDESDMQTMGALTQSDSPTISDTAPWAPSPDPTHWNCTLPTLTHLPYLMNQTCRPWVLLLNLTLRSYLIRHH